MSLISRLGVEQKGMFMFTMYHLVAAVANFAVLGLFGLGLFHVGIVAVLSLVAAWGLYGLRRWSLWIVVGLFFIVTTYSAVMLNASLRSYSSNTDAGGALSIVTWIAYLVLTWIATIYVAARRKNLR